MVAIGPATKDIIQSAIDKTHLTPDVIKSYFEQARDREIVISVQSPCKTDNTNMKGIQRTIKNMLNAIETVKKYSNLVSATASAVGETARYIQRLVSNAASEISGYVKNILGGVRGWVMNKLQEQAKKIFPFLFPGEIPELSNLINKAVNGLSCAFNKIVRFLQKNVSSLLNELLDRLVNAPLCAAQNFVGRLLDSILGSIGGTLENVLSPITSFVSDIAGKISNISGSLFNALDFTTGILNFFQCDDDASCPQVHEVSLAGAGVNNDEGGDPVDRNERTQHSEPSDGVRTPGAYTTGHANSKNYATELMQTTIRTQKEENAIPLEVIPFVEE